jgi:hypothetical protein
MLTFSVMGAWYVFGSFWTWLFAIAFAGGLVYRIRRGLPNAWWPQRWSRKFVLTGVNLGLLAALSVCLVFVTRARAYEAEPLRLSSPLRGAGFHVMGGGANGAVNHHFFIP